MPDKSRLNQTYMQTARLHAGLSRGIRAKVGAVLVTKHGVQLTGYNGTAIGDSNELEFINGDGEFITKPEVIHAELNCVLKAAKEGVSCDGSTIYVTHSPCLLCSAMLRNVGVAHVIYGELYKNDDGINLLKRLGIKVTQLKD